MADTIQNNTASSAAILEIRSLQKSFADNHVLKDISLDVEPEENLLKWLLNLDVQLDQKSNLVFVENMVVILNLFNMLILLEWIMSRAHHLEFLLLD